MQPLSFGIKPGLSVRKFILRVLKRLALNVAVAGALLRGIHFCGIALQVAQARLDRRHVPGCWRLDTEFSEGVPGNLPLVRHHPTMALKEQRQADTRPDGGKQRKRRIGNYREP